MTTTLTRQQAHDEIGAEFTRFKRDRTSRNHRMAFAGALTERYFADHAKMPDGATLDRLGTLILQDELADTHPDKMTREEYPLLSESQREERVQDERSLSAAQDVATDGRDYRVKTRDSNRKMRELYGE